LECGQTDGAEVLFTCCRRRRWRETVFANVFVLELNLDIVINLGRNIDSRETRLPLAFSVERADAHQAVHPGFALEVTVSHRARTASDALLIARLFVVLPIRSSTVYSCLPAQWMYIRSSISAQSLASVPPSRALIVTNRPPTAS